MAFAPYVEGPKCRKKAELPVPLYVCCTAISSKSNTVLIGATGFAAEPVVIPNSAGMQGCCNFGRSQVAQAAVLPFA
jgi:hypothetical protein